MDKQKESVITWKLNEILTWFFFLQIADGSKIARAILCMSQQQLQLCGYHGNKGQQIHSKKYV